MTVLQSLPGKIKSNGAAPVSTPDTPATIAPLPVAGPARRPLLFASAIWSVEHRPGFAVSSLYGRGK